MKLAPRRRWHELVFAANAVAGGSAVFRTREAIAETPAPGPLAYVSRERRPVADLRSGHRLPRLRQHRIPAATERLPAECIEGNENTDSDTARIAGDAIERRDGFEVDQDAGRDQVLFDQAQQVATAARDRGGAAIGRILLQQA